MFGDREKMALTPETARELIRRGESQTVEFKTRVPDPARLARLIAAFANADGGTLFVGLGDRGEVLGGDLEATSRGFHAALSRLRNAPKVDLEAVVLDGKHVATITVANGDRLVLTEDGAFTRVQGRVEVMPVPAISQVLKAKEAGDRRSGPARLDRDDRPDAC
jgi:predicted HTH transcriptional regulator